MLLLVSHDAGGAEILSSWLRRNNDKDVACVIEGPARRVFERKLGPVHETSLREGMARADALLCGTGWQSTLEFDALAMAREQGVHSTAWIDHWVNYRERFERGGRQVLPDEIWAGDEFALARVRELFPTTASRLEANPYFEDIRAEARLLPVRPASGPATVLYVCEPVRGEGFDEHEALSGFLSRLDSLRVPIERVVVRAHPSDPPGKYDWAMESAVVRVERGGERPLMAEIGDADIVVGLQSMAMVVGMLAGRRVVSCIPSGGPPCVLPFPEIETLGA
jgi:hypothetical protein